MSDLSTQRPVVFSRSRLQEVSRQLLGKRAIRILWNAAKGYDQDGCVYMAAAMSFYAMLSLIPLIMIGFWVLSILVGSSEEAKRELQELLNRHLVPRAAHELMQQVQKIADAGIFNVFGRWWGVLAFVWSGLSFYETLHSTLSIAWGGHDARPFFQRKLMVFPTFFIAGVFFLTSFYLTAAVTAIGELSDELLGFSISPLWILIAKLLPFALSVAMFFLIYKFLPNARVPWRLALTTATPVGILWELGKRLFAAFVTHREMYKSVYGPISSIILLMIWIYYSSTILLFGAEAGAAAQKEDSGDWWLETGRGGRHQGSRIED